MNFSKRALRKERDNRYNVSPEEFTPLNFNNEQNQVEKFTIKTRFSTWFSIRVSHEILNYGTYSNNLK